MDRSLLTFPWQIEGVLGNGVKSVSKSYFRLPGIIPGIDDEAAPDPDDEVDEPTAVKRQRTTVRRVGDEELVHVDIDVDELFGDVARDAFFNEYFDSEDTGDDDPFMDDDCLWQPFSELELCLDSELLAKIDEYGDKVEIMRLTLVPTTPEQYTGECGRPLSTKFVRTWRKKTRKEYNSAGNLMHEGPASMRRSRLVAMEFNWLESREDTFSPATSSAVVKLLPALAMSDGFIPNAILGTLDISDAFLQVPQSLPRAVTINGCSYIILRCLPGQRDASRLWFNYFVGRVQHHVDAVSCKEQPCILRAKNFGVLLHHVDDVLFMGDETWLRDTLIPKLESEFKMTYTIISRQSGGGFEFLKRYHEISPGYTSLTVHPESKHICTLFDRYTAASGKPPKLFKTPCVSSPSYTPCLQQKLNGTQQAQVFAIESYSVQVCTFPISTVLSLAWMVSWICQMKFVLAMMLLFSCVSVAAGGREVSDQALSLGLSPILGMCIFVFALQLREMQGMLKAVQTVMKTEHLVQEPEAEADALSGQVFNRVKYHVFLTACSEWAASRAQMSGGYLDGFSLLSISCQGG